jgi:hypothetical protein
LSATLPEAIAFLRRQYTILRHYAPLLWLVSVASTTFRSLVWLGTLAAIGWGIARGQTPWAAIVLGAAIYGLGAFRNWLLQGLADVYFIEHERALRTSRWLDIWAGPLTVLAQWLILCSTSLGHEIVWRGIRYRLLRGGRVASIAAQGPALAGRHHHATAPAQAPAQETTGDDSAVFSATFRDRPLRQESAKSRT